MLGTPAIVLGGPHLASPAPNKPVAKAIMLTSWQHHMDSVAERSKAVAQGATPVRAWVRTPPLSFLHIKQIGAGGPKPEHFFRTRHHSFFAASGCV